MYCYKGELPAIIVFLFDELKDDSRTTSFWVHISAAGLKHKGGVAGRS